jgi:ABC-type sugar transport system permease subunit
MATTVSEKRKVESPVGGDSTVLTVLRYGLLMFLDSLALILIYGLFFNGTYGLGIVLTVAVVGVNVISFVPALYPLRWMAPGLFFVTILVVYPIFYTVYTAFTNYGSLSPGHLFTKQQTIRQLETNRQYLYAPDDALTYSWSLYRDDADDLALLLTRSADDGTIEYAFAPVGDPIETIDDLSSDDLPETYNGYTQVPRRELAPLLGTLQETTFGTEDDTAAVRNFSEAARPLERLYLYDNEQDALVNQQTGVVYDANDEKGYFEARSTGEILNPGYRVNVGWFNFMRFFSDERLRGPLIEIFIWTVMFAFLSVFTTFVVGLFMALILNDVVIPGKKLVRSILIIPYAIPGVIAIVVWRGLFNENFGLINETLISLFGDAARVTWFGDPIWARVVIIVVNLWLGYPYMMLICSGALQAIPSDIYEAAAVDGASPVDRFWQITLPLLLVTVGPLLIASFVFNFNNYLIIEALTQGNPPIPNSPTPAGYTDILISYTYNLAFGNRNGADYGYASAITIINFILVAGVTLLQYRFTRTWEEVGENV